MKKSAAVLLSAALVIGAFPVPAIAAGGTQDAASEDASFFQMLWEEVQKNGEDMVTFPSRITDTLDPGESAYYGFYLEHPTDINLLLESDYPCYLMLCQKDQPVNVQTLPFATQKIEESGVPAGYYQIYVIPQEEFEKEQTSFTLSLGTFEEAGEEPDYSDFDPAGKVFNIVAPMYLLGGSDYPKYDKYGNITNTKNHTASAYVAGSYFLNWYGPVEEDPNMPSEEGGQLATPSNFMQFRPEIPSVHVQEMTVLPGAKNTADIGSGDYVQHWKNALMTQGPIEVGMCVHSAFWGEKDGKKTDEYFYAPPDFVEKYGKTFSITANHNVTVIGWDDTVPKEYFTEHIPYREYADEPFSYWDAVPPADGAWIIRNSWGNDRHASGDFYISYYDAFVGSDLDRTTFGNIESVRNYNHLYANDLGSDTNTGSQVAAALFQGKKKGMAVQCFQNLTEKEELLRAVSFGSPYSGYKYRIYVEVEGQERQLLKEGYRNYAGICTIRLDRGVVIPAGTPFNVYVAIELPSAAKADVGMFYSTSYEVNLIPYVGRTSAYYIKGDDSFESADGRISVGVGDLPVIHALCYADLDDTPEDPGNLVTTLNLDTKAEVSQFKTYALFKGAPYYFEKGIEGVERNGDLVYSAAGGMGLAAEADASEFTGEPATPSDMPKEEIKRTGTGSTLDGEGEDARFLPETGTEDDMPDTEPGYDDEDEESDLATPGNFRSHSDAGNEKGLGSDEDTEDPVERFFDFDLGFEPAEQKGKGEIAGDTEQNGTGLSHPETKVDYRDYNGGAIQVDFPETYSLAGQGQVTPVRNQGRSQLCWAFSAIKAVESAVMKNYQRLVSYPRGIRVEAVNGDRIVNGVIDIRYQPGEKRTLTLLPTLISDDISSIDNDTILWSYEGDVDCIGDTIYRSQAGKNAVVCSLKQGSGVVHITAQSSSDPSLTVTITLRITEDVPAQLSLSDTTVILQKGETYELKAEVTAAKDVKVIWSTDNPNVATVDENGRIFALHAGKAVITAKAGDAEASCTVYVESLYESYSKSSSSDSRETGNSVYSAGTAARSTKGSWILAEDGSWSFVEAESGQKAIGWRYIQTSDGQLHWFKFGEDQRMLTGWIRDPDGRWYYLAAPGDKTALSEAGMIGAMVTGWLKDPSDGYEYYLDLNTGAMVTGERTINGVNCHFNEFPAGATGWHFDEARQAWRYDGGSVIPMGAKL